MKPVKFFIARLCGSCLLCFGSAANADVSLSDLQPLFDDVDSISSDTDSIFRNTRYLQSVLDSLNQTATTQSEYQRNLLLVLNGGVTPPIGYTPISTLLQEIATNTRNAGNAVDVLAGNPWWATNSAFALTFNQYSRAYPSEYPNTGTTYSFPQFISRWSSMLTLPTVGQGQLSPSILRRDWWRYFGSLSRSADAGDSYPYTWFDWMTDSARSNWVLQASSIRALAGISNAVASSSGSGGSSFEDVLAANPWWATNSAFARNWQAYNYVWPRSEMGLSFPEAFSSFLASRTSTGVTESDLWDSWGVGGINQGHMYTWEDFIADAIKSNLVLQTSASISNLESELAATDYEEQVAPTNKPLPGYIDLVREADTSAGSSSLSTGELAVNAQIDALAGLLDSATPSSEIVVIPEFTVGGIHVQERRANLATSITPIAKRIMQFLWAVALFSSLFSLAQSEFAFYASVGRHWAVSHGALTERNV